VKVAFCTSWERERDGIAGFSAAVVPFLRSACDVEVVPLDLNRSDRDFYRRAAEQANRCDLCHMQHNYVLFNGLFPWRERFHFFLRRLAVPLVITFHEFRDRYPVSPLPALAGLADFLPRMKRAVLNRSSLLGMKEWLGWYHRSAAARAAVLHVHTSLHRRLLAGMGIDGGRIKVFPLPAPPHPLPASLPGREEARRLLGWEGRRVLLTPGFLNRRKGYEAVLSALGDLPGDALYVIAGGEMDRIGAPYREELAELCRREGSRGKVMVTGFLPFARLALMIAAADLVLAPFPPQVQGSASLSLSLGLGKAVLASDTETHRELSGLGAGMELVAADRPAEIAARANGLIRDSARRAALETASASFARKFGPEEYARRLSALYREALAG
jgi:glycosyltransferase involved in cell wall biosynthesis